MNFNFYSNLVSLYSQQTVQISNSVVHLELSSIQKLFYSNNSSMDIILHEPKSLSIQESKSPLSVIKDNPDQKQEIQRTTRKDISNNRSSINNRNSACSHTNPLFSNFCKYMQKVEVTYDQVTKRWQESEEEFTQLLKEMILQTEKQYQKRKLNESEGTDGCCEATKEERQDQLKEEKLRTQKKVQKEIFNGYSNSLSIISYSDQTQQLLNAPRKLKKRSKIKKLTKYAEEVEQVKKKQYIDEVEGGRQQNRLPVVQILQ